MTEADKQQHYKDADWLRETEWRWVRWHAPHPRWDHDHCVFCDAHFCDKSHAGALSEGWRHDYPDDPGNYEMVCAPCFSALNEIFRWRVLHDSKQE